MAQRGMADSTGVAARLSQARYGCGPSDRKLPKLWCFVTAGIVINTASVGSVIGFSAILLPQLRLPDSDIKIDASSASWIASIVGFALLIGNCITPYIMEKFGRRMSHISNTIPMIIGWFIVIYSQSVSSVIIGRLLQGIAMGVQVSIASVIIGEYASPKNRGFFLSMIALALAAGILMSHTLGIFLTWQWTALGCTVFPITALLISICSPETPSWLVSKNRFDEARESFYWLRGRDDLLDLDELEVLINIQILENKLKESAKLNEEENEGIIEGLRKPELYTPILIMFHLYIMYQFAGTNVLASYTIDILKAMVGEDANVYMIMFLIDILRLTAAVGACTIMKKFKRRKVMLYSGTLVLLSLLSMSAYMFLKRSNYFDGSATWIPTTLIALYTVALFSGLSQIPFALAGEIFPIAYRNLGAGISGVALSSMLFAAVKTAPPLFAAIGIDGTFFMYSGIVLYVLVYLYFILPETKDKTLQEIENEFKGVKEKTINPLDLSDFKSLQSLHSIKAFHNARRFSSPVCL